MPKYTAKLVVPVAKDIKDPVTAKLKVGQGVISQVSVTWTPGSQWLNALVVKYEGGQIIPSTGGGQCIGNGYTDTWPEHILLDKPHPELEIMAWNAGNDYEHDVLISIVILPIAPDVASPVKNLVKVLRGALGI